MPGLSVLSGPYESQIGNVDELFNSICFFEHYEKNREITTPRTRIVRTGYREYPVTRFETDDAVILVEGHVYDAELSSETLLSLVSEQSYEDLEKWLLGRDGDFLVTIFWKESEEITVVNDTNARLPTYYATIGETTVVSRELKCIREFARRSGSPLAIDQLAIGQQLLFEYVLGSRTVFDEVRSLPPGSLLHIDGDSTSLVRTHQWDFGTNAHADNSLAENARKLAEQFKKSCGDRHFDGTTSVVSLSGGLDSRAVAGGYHAAEIPFSTVTFDNSKGLYQSELDTAASIADSLDVEWEQYITERTSNNRSELLDIKQGMNGVGMSFLIDFFKQLRVDYDRPTYVTGDGGDKLLVDLTPPRQPRSMDDLVDLILDTHSHIPLSDAAEVSNVDEQDLRRSILQRLQSYPEAELSRRYVHFLFRERGVNLLHHGEDRNRYFCWSVSPFYSVPFFRFAINCPNEQKRNRKLYSAFLRELNPTLLEFEYADFGAPLTSTEFKIKQYVYDFLTRHQTLYDVVVGFLKDDSKANRTIANQVETVLARTPDFEPLSKESAYGIVENAESYRPYGLNALHTVALLVEDLSATPVRHPAEQSTR